MKMNITFLLYFFTKMLEFKRIILQGWYAVSKAVKEEEDDYEKSYTRIEVDFKSPFLTPSMQRINCLKQSENITTYQIINNQTNKIAIYGRFMS